jgi:hypothetical protein
LRRPEAWGISETVSIALAAAFVVAISIAVLTFVSSSANVTRQQEVQNLNKEQLVLKSVIGADYVYFPDWRDPNRGVANLRNTGDVTVTVLKLIVYRNGTFVHDTNPNYDPNRYVTLGKMEETEVFFMCPGCNPGDPVLVTVHYVPTELIDPRDPSRIEPLMRTMLFKVASFKAEVPGAGSVVLCPPSENWLFVDYVDPIETLVYQGNTLADIRVEEAVKLRISLSSESDGEIGPTSISVVLTDSNGNSASGSATVSGPLPIDVVIPLTAPSPLRYPLSVNISSNGYTVLPRIWRFNIDSDVVYPDFVKLNFDILNRLVGSVLISAYARDEAELTVSINTKDCNNRDAGGGYATMTLIPGSSLYINLQGSADLNPPVQLLMIYDVTVDYHDVTEIVWTTVTVTVTQTTTATLTSTTTKYVPSTVTTTITTTTTTTVYRITSTSTATTTRSVTATSFTTTTTTSTSTRYTYTTVYTNTVYITRTTTSTVYTSTTTLSRTTTVQSTSTVFSPTITQTITSYTTTYTTTRTLTETSTIGTTVTTTTTTTTTTTVRAGGSSVPPGTTAGSWTFADPSLPLVLIGGFSLAGISSPIIYRALRREGMIR